MTYIYRSLSKLVYGREFEGDEAHRTSVYLLVNEDSSLEAT
ncbi:MAG: hypothetical protein K0R02_180 [Rickettsiaceae bacterium]|jgi:RPE1 domain-containing protein|nr:hypothetical protein [Rickettsiaceae bacterium]